MIRVTSKQLAELLTIAIVLVAAAAAPATVVWDESANGALSNDRLTPTPLALAVGSNILSGSMMPGDRQYVSFSMPSGSRLTGLFLGSYVGGDPLSFIGVQHGTTFTEPPTGTNVGKLLGWTHFGPTRTPIGTDMLPALGRGAGATGFVPPLPADNYTFWIQQTGGGATAYSLDFVVVPEPARPGDYNQDGSVDAADYVVWRRSVGQTGAGLAADGNGDSLVNQADHDLWRSNFGATIPAGEGASASRVPEPAGLALASLLAALLIAAPTHRRARPGCVPCSRPFERSAARDDKSL
jgi:hypothetical protein